MTTREQGARGMAGRQGGWAVLVLGMLLPGAGALAAPTTAEEWTQSAGQLCKEGKWDEAMAAATRALALDPKSAPAYYFRSGAELRKELLNEALADIDKCLALDQETDSFPAMRAVILLRRGDLKGSRAAIDRAILLDPKDPSHYHLRAALGYQTKDLDQALQDINAAIHLSDKEAGFFRLRGSIYFEQGSYLDAEAEYSLAVTMEPLEAGTYVDRGNVRVRLGHLEDAVADYTRAIELQALNSTYMSRGRCRLLQHRWREAAADFEQSSALGNESTRLVAFLWVARTRGGEGEKADKELGARLDREKGGKGTDGRARLLGFLAGRNSEQELLAGVKGEGATGPRHCEAYYYAGIKRLAARDEEGARGLFREAVAAGKADFPEWQCAQSELGAATRP